MELQSHHCKFSSIHVSAPVKHKTVRVVNVGSHFGTAPVLELDAKIHPVLVLDVFLPVRAPCLEIMCWCLDGDKFSFRKREITSMGWKIIWGRVLGDCGSSSSVCHSSSLSLAYDSNRTSSMHQPTQHTSLITIAWSWRAWQPFARAPQLDSHCTSSQAPKPFHKDPSLTVIARANQDSHCMNSWAQQPLHESDSSFT